MHVQALKLNGPVSKPLNSDRAVGDVNIGDLPLRDLVGTGGKIESFVDIILNEPLDLSQAFWDNTIYNLCAQAKYSQLPSPFSLAAEPTVPYSMQIIAIPSTIPPDANRKYINIVKHIFYLHKNKVSPKDGTSFCHSSSLKLDWGHQVRLGLMVSWP